VDRGLEGEELHGEANRRRPLMRKSYTSSCGFVIDVTLHGEFPARRNLNT
jgi:hypothetical protein